MPVLTTTEEPIPPAARTEAPRFRLDYLDGIRGLAALYVVLHHVFQELLYSPEVGRLPHRMVSGLMWMGFGNYSVVVFIVLSGYCLMLPVARSADGRLAGGWRDYLRRRARRILPPYYAALAVTLLLIALIPGMHRPAPTRWGLCLPAFTPGVLFSHLALVDNVSWAWQDKINYPMWSVATEWQIYFLFPLILLPVWRRFGLAALVVAGFAVGLAPHFLLPMKHNYDVARPWYVGLFALGMLGAAIGFSLRERIAQLRSRIPWGTLAVVLTAIVAVSHLRHWQALDGIARDALLGAGTVCLIVYCTQFLTQPGEPKRPAILRFFESRWVVALGVFSYSLYLIHAPVLALLHLAVWGIHASPLICYAALLGLGVPLSVLCAYLFYLRFEKPFLSSRTRVRIRQPGQA